MSGRKFHIPLTISPLFLALVFFIGYLSSGGNTVLALYFGGVAAISVFVHELGHALAGIAFGQKVSIALLPYGGVTRNYGKPLKGWQEFILILMGPLFGFALFLLSKTAIPMVPQGALKDVFIFGAMINLFWTVFNLLPILPLDGGQLVRVLLQGIWGTKGLKAACFISMFCGIALALWALLTQQFFLASILGIFIYESWQIFNSVRFLTDMDADVELQRLMSKGEKAYDKYDLDKAAEIFHLIRQKVNKGMLYNQATYYLADIALVRENAEEAFSLLKPIFRELNMEGIKRFHDAAMGIKAWKEALESGLVLWQKHPSKTIAQDNQKASQELGDETAAKGWEKAASAYR